MLRSIGVGLIQIVSILGVLGMVIPLAVQYPCGCFDAQRAFLLYSGKALALV
jgi:hypothetical protein